MIGHYLDMVPEWIMMIIAALMALYYIQIIAGICIMADHLKYPKIPISEFEKMIIWPFYLYYVSFFTDKLLTIEEEKVKKAKKKSKKVI